MACAQECGHGVVAAGSPARTIRSPWRAPRQGLLGLGQSPTRLSAEDQERRRRAHRRHRSKAAISDATPLRGSSVPTKATSGRSGGTPFSARSARSAPGDGSRGVKRAWSTPWGATTIGARTSQQARRRVGRDLTHADERRRVRRPRAGSPGGRRAPWIARATRDDRRTCSRGSSRHRARVRVSAWCSAARGGPARPRSSSKRGKRTCSKARRPGREAGTARRRPAPRRRRQRDSSVPHRRDGPPSSRRCRPVPTGPRAMAIV